VYKEKAVSATVAKIYDGAATLSRPNFDVKAAEAEINKWYKACVAKITLTDNSASGGAKDVHFDLNGNGRLDVDPVGTSPEVAAITAAFNPTGQKVIIVKDLAWIFYLKSAASKDATTITLKDSLAGFVKYLLVGNQYKLGAGATEESVKIKSSSGTTITLDAKLTKDHPATDGVIFPLNGASGNPIYVNEGALSEAQVRQVIGHENGHNWAVWLDLEARNNLMHYTTQQRTDTKIRYKAQPRKYVAGTENQWDKVSR
jgi:hypothetical protein